MHIQPATLFTISFFLLLPPGISASESHPTADQAAAIETHAASWDLVLKREHLKAMTTKWRTLISDPDTAAAYFGEMLPLANSIVDQLTISTRFSRGMIMRWLENDVGVKAYFFPPHPEQEKEEGGGGILRILGSLIPIVLYRLVDQVIGD